MELGQRYFQGIVWVDDRDVQIVRSYGRGVGLLKKAYDQQFPKFETYREQIDGKFRFPTYTAANDTLWFESGPVRIRMNVRVRGLQAVRRGHQDHVRRSGFTAEA